MTSIPVGTCRIFHNNLKRSHLKKEKRFQIFYCISQMCMKFQQFEEKDEYSSLVISKIIESERSGYLNV